MIGLPLFVVPPRDGGSRGSLQSAAERWIEHPDKAPADPAVANRVDVSAGTDYWVTVYDQPRRP